MTPEELAYEIAATLDNEYGPDDVGRYTAAWVGDEVRVTFYDDEDFEVANFQVLVRER